MGVDGEVLGALHEGLVSAYTRDELEPVMRFRLDRRLDRYSLGGNWNKVAYDVVDAADREGWFIDLCAAAHASNPGNPVLAEAAARVDLAINAKPVFEAMVDQGMPMVDPAEWRERLARIETQVCRIEIPTAGVTGTGFLVGPAAVATNHHVARPVIDGTAQPSDVKLRFDFKRLAGRVGAEDGTVHGLAAEWLIDSSPPSDVDELINPNGRVPGTEELDYAILRVDAAVGADPIGEHPEPGAKSRGWIELDPREPPDAGTPVLIVQHPEDQPLKLAWGGARVTNSNETRVRYDTNTLGGSSGSPCFDGGWNLVALHHLGDPKWAILGQDPDWNQGITLKSIAALLDARGKRQAIEAG